ncbi:MAG: hypothetical protein SV186_06635 [Candidatus Nanohaloarchaea archaeon]|nr:hypothetical protein [Candidatus Nanohaloarchaea archaeon]
MGETRVCPNCGSEDVSRTRSTVTGMLGLDNRYECGRCGYTGNLFPVMDEEETDEHREALREEKSFEEMDDYEPPETPVSGWRVVTGVVMVLLGLGSLPLASRSGTALVGSLLIPIGAMTIYREVRKYRSS